MDVPWRLPLGNVDEHTERGQVRIALVSMPFASLTSPSIQLGLLKRVAERAGFAADALYLAFDFARRVGPDLYQAIADANPRIPRRNFVPFGEWLFSKAAFLDEAPDAGHALLLDFADDVDGLIADAHSRREDERLKIPATDGHPGAPGPLMAFPEASRELLVHIRDVVAHDYLTDAVRSPVWESVDVVGFTSTFEQNVPSFALARLLKEAYPDLTIVFGGSNLEGEMGREWFRKMPFIDYMVSGDGEAALVYLLKALADGNEPRPVHGLIGRQHLEAEVTVPRTVLRDLDSLPVPDYDDFYRLAAESGFFGGTGGLEASITFETSRGCWWGERSHCTFCGLNGLGMSFRAKSAPRVLAEFAELQAQYESSPLKGLQANKPLFFCADNIVPMHYFDDVFPALSAAHAPYPIFYEVKANLSRERIRVMRDAGVTVMQPGIESLSSHVLALMRKGIHAIHNVNCLRWARYYRILTAWNVLFGFPGETAEDYQVQAELIPLLWHLNPPEGCGRVRMDRFSPLFEDTVSYPATRRTPMPSYRYTYPARVELDRTAYFFDHEFVGALPSEAYLSMRRAVARWQQVWRVREHGKPFRAPSMTFRVEDGVLQIDDRRNPGEPHEHVIDDRLAAMVYEACSEKPLSAQGAGRRLPSPGDTGRVHQICEDLAHKGLMMSDGDVFLSLALPAQKGHARPGERQPMTVAGKRERSADVRREGQAGGPGTSAA